MFLFFWGVIVYFRTYSGSRNYLDTLDVEYVLLHIHAYTVYTGCTVWYTIFLANNLTETMFDMKVN